MMNLVKMNHLQMVKHTPVKPSKTLVGFFSHRPRPRWEPLTHRVTIAPAILREFPVLTPRLVAIAFFSR